MHIECILNTRANFVMKYSGNPKHNDPFQPGRKGSRCPTGPKGITLDVAQELLEHSEVSGKRRFAIYDKKGDYIVDYASIQPPRNNPAAAVISTPSRSPADRIWLASSPIITPTTKTSRIRTLFCLCIVNDIIPIKKRIAHEKAEMIVGTAIPFLLPTYQCRFKRNGSKRE